MAADKRTLYDGFILAEWQIAPLRGQIRSLDGAKHHVTPKAMDVLVSLASKPKRVVSRSELLEEVWGDDAASDEALTHCISELRHAFNDSPDDPKFFHTVPKRGYRLIAEVSVSSNDSPATGSRHCTDREPRRADICRAAPSASPQSKARKEAKPGRRASPTVVPEAPATSPQATGTPASTDRLAVHPESGATVQHPQQRRP